MSSHSADNKGSDHGTFVYAFEFLSPFDKQGEGDKNLDMVANDARLSFMRIYKTSDGNPEKQVIPQIAEDSIPWLKDNITDEERNQKIKKTDFSVSVISSVLYSLKEELGLHYTLLQSRDKDEIFCQIYVTENWMHRHAALNEYELQLKPKPNHSIFNFKQVPPYAPASLMEYKDKKGELNYHKHFKRYDHMNRETEDGISIYTTTDKRRLVMNVIRQRLDLHSLKASGVMTEDFCVHEAGPLDDLKKNWANFGKLFSRQPLDDIRTYFAEKIALYFAWIDVYWRFMMISAVTGLVTAIVFLVHRMEWVLLSDSVQIGFQIFYAIFLAFWASSFEQVWTRQENRLSWKWGTKNLDLKEEQRSEFVGIFEKDEVSGKMKVLPDPKEKKWLKTLLTYCVIFFFMCVVVVMVSLIFYFRFLMKKNGKGPWLTKVLPGVLNALQIRILNIIYGKVVAVLNNWENHETENQQYDNLALKTFLFKFVNSYFSLFYMAFLKYSLETRTSCLIDGTSVEACPSGSLKTMPGCENCMNDLGFNLTIIFVINMGMNIMELGLPWLKWKLRLRSEDKKIEEALTKDHDLRKELYPVEYDSKLEAYETPSDDYMEMIIQFGYVALFGVSSPIIALLALIEITLEIRVDAWKICNLTKRPDPLRAKTLGVWKSIIVTVAYVGSITNSAIIVFTSKLFKNYGFADKVLLFIIIEHALLGVMYLVSTYVNDVPSDVQHGHLWSKRKVDGKFLNWKDHEEVTAEYRSSKGGEAFFIEKKDLLHHE